MNQSWLIVRTEYRYELTVARQIEALGYPTYVPMEVRFHRITSPTKVKRAHTWEVPALPTVAFASVPDGHHGELVGLRAFVGLWRPDPVSGPYRVSPEQIDAFRDMVDRENAIRRRQFARKQEGKRGKKTVKLDPDGLAVLMKELFGLEVPEMEMAA